MQDQRPHRLQLLERWQAACDSTVIVVGTRRDASLQMSECVRYLYEHFRELPQRPVDRIDLVLLGSGLSPEVGARVSSLLREYARELRVVVTGAVGSGETLAAIAADVLLMHPMATLTTALPSSQATPDVAGLDGIVAHLLADGDAGQQAYDAMLQSTSAALVGDAIHRVEWVRHQLRHLSALRLVGPSEEDVDALVDLLTRRVQRVGEPIDRRTARTFAALPVTIPKPDTESLIFDMHLEYERGLDLLSPTPRGPRAVIESTRALHTLDSVQLEDGTPAMHWLRHFDAVLH